MTEASPPASTECEPDSSMDPATREYKLDDLITFRVVDGECLIESPSDGGTSAFPARILPVLMRFVTWTPLYNAFIAPVDDANWSLASTMALIRELVARGVLMSRDEAALRSRQAPSADWREVWSKWSPALAFYLASRTRAGQPYFTLEEMDDLLWEKSDHDRQPSAFKDFHQGSGKPLDMPPADLARSGRPDGFLSVLLRRRTCRSFSSVPMSRQDIGTLLYLTWGATSRMENRMGEDVFLRKTSPSGGSLHPTEVYPLIMNVRGIEPGLYHYSVRRHALEHLSSEDPRTFIVDACGGQPWIAGAAAVFLTTSVVRRVAWKYEFPRAFRYVFLDVGHLSQTFYLVAAWLGLGAFVTGGLRDEIFEQKIGLDPLHEPVLLLNGVGVASSEAARDGRTR